MWKLPGRHKGDVHLKMHISCILRAISDGIGGSEAGKPSPGIERPKEAGAGLFRTNPMDTDPTGRVEGE